ncbi:HIT family protein [Schaalia sp. 19OD2882]|uniref:HIT family protein n=1 Tax=Schaalia sp. 19OD2882 TaxID=2794089 RepID=UPI001C1E9455|nr:HIT family protein [Schaalia sp. 19OD2882]QWW20384.1 HIT family protein [Schaalia sp. 19OD2882]
MSTVFEKIISGQWPGRFVWADDVCVAFATIAPVAPGHVLVVPREPWAKWTDAPSDVASHLMKVARHIGLAQEAAFDVSRSGLVIAGFEVPHTHLHVIPLTTEKDVNLAHGRQAAPEELDSTMEALRIQLLAMGHQSHVPTSVSSPALS